MDTFLPYKIISVERLGLHPLNLNMQSTHFFPLVFNEYVYYVQLYDNSSQPISMTSILIEGEHLLNIVRRCYTSFQVNKCCVVWKMNSPEANLCC